MEALMPKLIVQFLTCDDGHYVVETYPGTGVPTIYRRLSYGMWLEYKICCQRLWVRGKMRSNLYAYVMP
jgi:hypothetical protein